MKLFVPSNLFEHQHIWEDSERDITAYLEKEDGSKQLVHVFIEYIMINNEPGEIHITELKENNLFVRNEFCNRLARFYYLACYNGFWTSDRYWLPKDFVMWDTDNCIFINHDVALLDLEDLYRAEEDLKMEDLDYYLGHSINNDAIVWANSVLSRIANFVGLTMEWDVSHESSIKLVGKQYDITDIDEAIKYWTDKELTDQINENNPYEFVKIEKHPYNLGLKSWLPLHVCKFEI